jgi:hypothetical protein
MARAAALKGGPGLALFQIVSCIQWVMGFCDVSRGTKDEHNAAVLTLSSKNPFSLCRALFARGRVQLHKPRVRRPVSASPAGEKEFLGLPGAAKTCACRRNSTPVSGKPRGLLLYCHGCAPDQGSGALRRGTARSGGDAAPNRRASRRLLQASKKRPSPWGACRGRRRAGRGRYLFSAVSRTA